jgi:tetratricopeptide (TPR) repeat protein
MAMVLVGLAANYAIADTESEEVSAHVRQAEIALQQQEYKKAASEYRKAAELSRNVDVATKATRVTFSYGFNEEALRSAQRWVKLDEDSEEALLYVAQIQLRLGDIKASRRAFKSLLKRGEQPADERLISLIPFLSQEDAENADGRRNGPAGGRFRRGHRPCIPRTRVEAGLVAGTLIKSPGNAACRRSGRRDRLHLEDRW